MSIIPAGKRREQVAQGPLKNQSILESALFKKFGQVGALVDEEDRAAPPGDLQQTSDLQQTMGDSRSQLNMQDNIPGADAGQQSQLPQQSGMSGSSPASQFLGPDPDAQGQADPNQLYMAERQKIRGFIGNDFGMNLISGGDGTFTIKIKPPGNVPVQNPTGFMNALLQAIGGASVTEENTPAVSDSGKELMLKYRPSGAGPEKITKGKGGRR